MMNPDNKNRVYLRSNNNNSNSQKKILTNKPESEMTQRALGDNMLDLCINGKGAKMNRSYIGSRGEMIYNNLIYNKKEKYK